MLATTPANKIRRYLDQNGGEVEVPVDNLTVSWSLSDWTFQDAEEIAAELATDGIETRPALTELPRDGRVLLRLADQTNGVAANGSAHQENGGELSDESAPTAQVAAEQWPAAWYSDPDAPNDLRYWDGYSWTQYTHSRDATPPPPAASAPKPPASPGGPSAPDAGTGGSKRPWWQRPWVLIAAGLVAAGVTVAVLSSPENSGKSGGHKQAVATKPLRLRVMSPDNGSTIRAHSVLVKGVVTPGSAAVTVDGDPVRARGGRFSHRVRLRLGENTISVLAQRRGFEDGEFSATVTRKRTAQEVAAVQEARRQRQLAREERQRQREQAREQQRQQEIAAATQSFSGSGSKNIGTITVDEESILEWTNSGDPEFRNMLIYDADFGINVGSEAGSGDTVVPPGTYHNITVAGDDSWSLTIHPR
jgi:glucodextranase-like protein/uncharacterized protein DUF2510